MLRTFHTIPRTSFVFQRKNASEIVIQHDAYIALHVGLAEAIPELSMNGGMCVGSQVLQTMIEKILVFPITEVGTSFAERTVDLFHEDSNIDGVGSKAPVVFERDVE